MPKTAKDPADYIVPLYINGLSGRMAKLPAPRGKDREILFIYGQHSSLERWWGLIMELNKYGGVTVPDMPGFGDMTSLYKIGQHATIDELADYLAAFLKLRFNRKKVTIAAMSLGFVIVTRMLQRYPSLTKNVDMLISIVGFGHGDDFIFPPVRKKAYIGTTKVLSFRLTSLAFKYTFLQPVYLRRAYKHSSLAKEKFKGKNGDEFKKTMDAELILWKINDIRTQMQTNYEMLTLDNTHKKVDLPVWHIGSKKDRYFDHVRVEEHLRRIYTDFHIFYTKDPNHAPTIIATQKEASAFIPDGIRKQFNKK